MLVMLTPHAQTQMVLTTVPVMMDMSSTLMISHALILTNVMLVLIHVTAMLPVLIILAFTIVHALTASMVKVLKATVLKLTSAIQTPAITIVM